MRFVTHTDVHQADKAPRGRVDDWTESISEKLRQVFKYAKDRDAFNLCAGDIFNYKAASKNSHGLVRRTIEDYRLAGHPVPVCAGSHDFPYSDTERLKTQPLGVMESAGVVKLLDYKKGTHHLITQGEDTARIIGFPDDNKWDDDTFKNIEEFEGLQIALVHTFASNKINKFFDQTVYQYKDLAKLPVDVWVFGHWHMDQGIEILKGPDGNKKVFINVGAVSRGAYSDENLDRIPALAYLDISKKHGKTIINKAEQVPLKVKPFSEVFNIDVYEKRKQKEEEVSRFIEELSKVEEDLKVESSEEYFAILSISDEVRKRIGHYLELAGN